MIYVNINHHNSLFYISKIELYNLYLHNSSDNMKKGQTVGYIRVSSEYQNIYRQKSALVNFSLDELFIDYASGKNTFRPQLIAALQYLRKDDTFIICSMDRLARNLDDLRKLVQELTSRGIKIQFVKENLIFEGGDTSPMSSLLLSMMGAFAEFERSLIIERQKEGIELAKKRGVYKGRMRCLSNEQIEELRKKDNANNHKNRTNLAIEFNISRQTVYNYLKKST